MTILLQMNKMTFEKSENLEKKNHISQNLAKMLTENCFFKLFSWFFLTPKRLRRGQFDSHPPPPSHCGFLKNVTSRKTVKPWFFVTFIIIISHIFPEN